MTSFPFQIKAREGNARTGVLKTPRGDIRTPAFMPVGTAATVKALYMDQVEQAGADIILGNTYHLMLRPGAERVKRLGGLHSFAHWDGPMLTDSGGFQVWSLAQLRKGVRLAEGWARVERLHVKRRRKHTTVLEIVLSEGRNREIRRILARAGHKVRRLQRTALGPLRLGDVPPGAHRRLTKAELKKLKHVAGLTRGKVE